MNDEIEKKYLGIDWGKAEIGLALANNETKMAFSYGKLKNDKNILKNILKIIFKEEIKIVVIGVPMYKNKKENKFGGKKFGELIKKEVGDKIKIVYQDEMFTTKIAERNLIAKGLKKIKRFDDAESARIILESWLDTYNNKL